MDEQDKDEKEAESLVRMALMVNEISPKFDPDGLRALVAAAEVGKVTWTQIANLLDAMLSITFAFEESTQQRSRNGQSDGQEPVIDPTAYGLTI